jgi:DNA-binding response OmpR family regulator
VDAPKILIVDDDRSYLMFTAVNLRQAGYAVVTAVDAIGAISIAVREKPDLVILDLGLPAGDGFVVLERLRMNLQLAGVPVVIVTARDADSNMNTALKAGAWGLFQKPVESEVLLGAVRSALGEAPEPARSPERRSFRHVRR